MNEAPNSPIRTLSYSLTRADALAYKLLKHELTGWEKFRLLVFVGCGGLIVGLMPDNLSPAVWWTIAAGVLGLFGVLAIVWTNVSVRRQAAAIPMPEGAVELEEWGDHLAEKSAKGVRSVAFERIAQVIRTDAHIFIREGAAPLIIPKTAFNDDEDMRVFAEAIDKASDRAQP
jgi:hypothetical protein